MDDHPTRSDTSLYDQDFYAWTQEQAALLKEGRLSAADVPNILEEIETLGRKELSELRARLRMLCAHMIEEMYQSKRSSRSWKTTILNQRIAIADHMSDNPSLKPKLAAAFAKAYADARELASSETELPLSIFPEDPPFSCDDALSRSWMPRAVAAASKTRKLAD